MQESDHKYKGLITSAIVWSEVQTFLWQVQVFLSKAQEFDHKRNRRLQMQTFDHKYKGLITSAMVWSRVQEFDHKFVVRWPNATNETLETKNLLTDHMCYGLITESWTFIPVAPSWVLRIGHSKQQKSTVQ